MPQRSNAFQTVVRLVQEQLASDAIVTESKPLTDVRTGEPREVDVCIEAMVGSYSVAIAVECIDQARKATVNWVEQMSAKHADLPTNKLVLISRAGFTGPALTKAKELGFDALALEEAERTDWATIVGRVEFLYMDVVNSSWKACVVVASDQGQRQAVPATKGLLLHGEGVTGDTTVGALAEGIVSLPDVARVLLDHMHNKGLKDNTFTAEYTFPDEVVALDSTGLVRRITALRIVFDATRSQTPVPLRHGQLQQAHVAFGEAEGPTGTVRIAAMEREGKELVCTDPKM